ncbi:hypothetical protein SETIT_9G282600v2 [Setaria italica]|uniref:Uncharacterized protein n=1 Tax=Setaria italica TaxID=4555 RepID=K4AFW3_SETIT|nr:uncharacterized protein LOC101780928 [Setaria italica]XP_004983335.1 uncharacterized protein LOC101780928 [Setaria italica]RCV43290.1 hypothetical protein SETIT_9G282600v2 [Setaria italica]RCV43291.1 hypothetical protein SETIT_9G282600v2 [Setaria italica]RCV43292.1 hypothetical protein SETIT_9G282600v2 [Setaria italica]
MPLRPRVSTLRSPSSALAPRPSVPLIADMLVASPLQICERICARPGLAPPDPNLHQAGASAVGAVAHMTAALADALRVFYPLAGRICQDTGGALAVEGDKGPRSSRPRPRASPSTTSPEMAATRRPSGSCSASCPTPTRAWRFPRSSDKESIRDAGNLFDQMPERCSCWWS